MNDESKNAAQFAAHIGIVFAEPKLLRQALTHSSYVNEYAGAADLRDNERLEFLGDAVLDVIVADLLYRRFPHVSEGDLTQMRSALVKAESLAQIAANFALGDFLLVGHGEELSGGRERLSTLCRGLEAVVGAIYLDQGLGAAENFIGPALLELLDDVLANRRHIDARGELQERVQARLNITPDYRVIGEDGPEHAKVFRVQALLADNVIGCGRGPSKRAAAQAAAADALQRLDAGRVPASVFSEREG